MKITIVSISIVIYVLCVIFSKKYITKEHSIGGMYDKLDTKFSDLLLVFVPILNFILTFDYFDNKIKFKNKNRNYNKFFNVKK